VRLLLAVLFLAGRAAGAPAVRAVDAVGVTVGDLGRSVDFYTTLLGFEQVSQADVGGDALEQLRGVFPLHAHVATLRLGDERLQLTEYVAPRGRPVPADSRSNDRWFQHVAIVVSDMDRAYQRLHDAHIAQISPGPQRLPDWNPNAGGIRAFYFRDPDGHPLELIWFPPGKGDRRWQQPGDRLFLGIDHTAIGVADTTASLRFYRDRLGFRVAGTGENWGPEQARLNAVAGAHLRITGLRAAAGPGVELLEYLAPHDGRRRPADVRPNDLVHWQIEMTTGNPSAVAPPRAACADTPERPLGFTRACLTADPDGHAVELVDGSIR